MLKQASTWLGLSPNDAMHLAEKLYLGGYTTYPRTESTSYPKTFDFMGILESFIANNHQFRDYSGFLLQNFNKPLLGTDAGDHPPITPTVKIPRPDQLNQNEAKLYEYICRTYLASISPDAKFAKTKIHFQIGAHGFNLNGSIVKNRGFTEITPWVKISDKLIPDFRKGETYYLSALDVVEGHTTPPDYLTESELLS